MKPCRWYNYVQCIIQRQVLDCLWWSRCTSTSIYGCCLVVFSVWELDNILYKLHLEFFIQYEVTNTEFYPIWAWLFNRNIKLYTSANQVQVLISRETTVMYLVQRSVFQIMFIFNLYFLLSCYHEGKLQLLAIIKLLWLILLFKICNNILDIWYA